MSVSTPTQFGTDCKLMLHMDGTLASTTFTDSSFSNTKTVSPQGNAQIDTGQSKFGGASGIFDGTGDFLTVPNDADWNVDADFTIDFWVRFNVVGSAYLCSRKRGASGNACDLLFLAATLNFIINDVTVVTPAPAWTPNANQWYHIAIIRSGTNCYIFVDGTQLGSTGTNSATVSETTVLSIAAYESGNLALNGWMDEFRFVKGTAVWTSTFTPPSSAYTKVIVPTTGIKIPNSSNLTISNTVNITVVNK